VEPDQLWALLLLEKPCPEGLGGKTPKFGPNVWAEPKEK